MRPLHLQLLFLITLAAASPLLRQQTPPDVEPDAELLPLGASPSPLITQSSSPQPGAIASPIPSFVPPSLTPIPSPTPLPTEAPSTQPTPSPPFTPPASPSASPPTNGPPPPPTGPDDTDGDGDPDDFDGDATPDVDEPEPTPLIEGGDSNRAALAGGLTGGLFGLVLLILCIFCVVLGGKKKGDDTGTGIYTSTEAGVGPSAGETSTEGAGAAAALEKDEARGMGPVAAGAAGAGAGAGTGAGVGAEAAVTAAGAAAVVAGEEGKPVIARGPTPPPHDYVLGAGPAATRKDFVDLRSKFERDEIGDNSAVLGVERGGVVGEGLERDTSAGATQEAAVVGSTALPHETETAPGVDIKPESLPDRGGPVPMTFESQERLMAGGDGSGAISDVAMSLNAASIAEESGDVPSLERDPIIRDRDQTF